MCGISHFWIFPILFIGMMIIGMILSRRRDRWSCWFPYNGRYDYRDRIRRLEEEIERLKGKENA